MKYFKSIIMLPLILAACGAIMGPTLDERIDEHFPNREVAAFVRCVLAHPDTVEQHCTIDRALLNYRREGTYHRGGLEWPYESPLEFMMLFADGQRGGTFNPNALRSVVRMGADSDAVLLVSRGIMTFRQYDYLVALVEGMGDINAYTVGSGEQNILHEAVSHMDPMAVEIILRAHPDLEQRDGVGVYGGGETALLMARHGTTLLSYQIGSIAMINLLLDAGARADALDSKGRGLCSFLIEDYRLQRHLVIQEGEREALRTRLHEEYGMDC